MHPQIETIDMYIYIIECSDHSLYTGIAKDIVERLKDHYLRRSACAKYTRSHPMRHIRAIWLASDKVTACQLEYRIKHLTRHQKDALIVDPVQIELLPCNGTATPLSAEELVQVFNSVTGSDT